MVSVWVQKGISRNKVKKAIDKLKGGKPKGIDGTTVDMLEYEKETVVELMCLICYLAWRQREVPDEWKAITVLLHKGKGSKDEFNN